MITPHNDALLVDMIRDAEAYKNKMLRRRANGVRLREPKDVIAFYDRQISDANYRSGLLRAARKKKCRRRSNTDGEM